jgi:hypothetical protein
MLRQRALLIAVLGQVLVAMLIMMVLGRPLHRSPVYSVAKLRSHLLEDPQPWLGRTLLVRGEAIARGCRAEAGTLVLCSPRLVFLTDPGPTLAGASLPLVSASPDPWLTSVRRLPLLGSVLPPPQVVHWGQVAVYRVRVRSRADTSGGPASYEAVLLDAAPDAPEED